MVRKRYRASVLCRRTSEDVGKHQPCGHAHRSDQSAAACGVATIRRLSTRGPLRELGFLIECTHSRHDWFPL